MSPLLANESTTDKKVESLPDMEDRRTDTETHEWSIAPEIDEVAALVREAAEVLKRHGVTGEPLYTAQLAIEEVVSNVVRHGACKEDRGVDIHIDIDDDEIRITVEDEGRPFDPSCEAPAPDFDAPLEERRVGGLGVYLVKQMANRFDYERDGELNRLEVDIARAAS